MDVIHNPVLSFLEEAKGNSLENLFRAFYLILYGMKRIHLYYKNETKSVRAGNFLKGICKRINGIPVGSYQ